MIAQILMLFSKKIVYYWYYITKLIYFYEIENVNVIRKHCSNIILKYLKSDNGKKNDYLLHQN